eukprot:TRINITY_DN4606_c0_g1_i3.p1 TRINITY_DN4606_c0_g1~~TRINITY_DN4606_c0_g1_i3.p1  ORF type:complete len:1405 (-),score=187.75 TRINITY_DN4606_c0_g1_i3:142-4356(-)
MEEEPTLESVLNAVPDEISEDGSDASQEVPLSPSTLAQVLQETESDQDQLEDESSVIPMMEGLSIPDPSIIIRNIEKQVLSENPLVLRNMPMISQFLLDLQRTKEHGMPTCCVIHPRCILIATSHGVIFVFDKDQKNKGHFGANVGLDHGSILSIDIARSGDWVICGHAQGCVALWDLDSRTLIKTVTSIHKQPVMGVRFLCEKASFISIDLLGSVYLHNASKVFRMMVVSSECILDGSIGVITAADLISNVTFTVLQERLSYLAFCTQNMACIIAFHPKPDIIFKLTRPESEGTQVLPYLAWRAPVSPTQDSRNSRPLDPILAIGWGRKLSFILLTIDEIGLAMVENRRPQLQNVGRVELPHAVESLSWLAEKYIIVLTQQRSFHLVRVDVATGIASIMDTITTEPLNMVSHSRFTLSLKIYERAYHQSHRSSGRDEACFMGTEKFFHCRLIGWNERIKNLTDKNCDKEALIFATSFYSSVRGIAVGLPSAEKIRKDYVKRTVIELLESYMTKNMPQMPLAPGASKIAFEDFRARCLDVGIVCIESCTRINDVDYLYRIVYKAFEAIQQVDIFFELLDVFILHGSVKVITLEILQGFIESHVRLGLHHRIEPCLLLLDLSSIKSAEILEVCQRYKLYDAFIHIYNRLAEYVHPLRELMKAATDQQNEGNFLHEKLILYVNCCLAGKAYPAGDIPGVKVRHVQMSILHFLFSTTEGNQILNLVLSHTPCEFLNSLSFPMDDDVLFSDQQSWDGKFVSRQTIFEHLFPIYTGAAAASGLRNKPVELQEASEERFFEFVARLASSGKVSLNAAAKTRVVSYLIKPSNNSAHSTREELLLDMAKHNSLDSLDSATILPLVEGAGMHRVAEYLYLKRGNYRKVMQCMISSIKTIKTEIFRQIDDLATSSTISTANRREILDEVARSVDVLLHCHEEMTFQLLQKLFLDHNRIFALLDSRKDILYRYIRHAIQGKDKRDGPVPEAEFNSITSIPEFYEKYIDLMCQYARGDVYNFLLENDCYKLDVCLSICEKYHVASATSYLLERMGDFKRALSIILDDVPIIIQDLSKNIAQQISSGMAATHIDTDFISTIPCAIELRNTIARSTSLCLRNLQRIDDSESQAMWFRILDSFVSPRQKMTHEDFCPGTSEQVRSLVKGYLTLCVQLILNDMMSQVSLPIILKKVVDDHGKDTFAEFKPILQGMLDSYNYERTLLATANKIFAKDVYEATRMNYRQRAKALYGKSTFCHICGVPLSLTPNPTDLTVIYECGHTFHSTCIEKDRGCPFCMAAKTLKKQSNLRKEMSPVLGPVSGKDSPKIEGQSSSSNPSQGNRIYAKRLLRHHSSQRNTIRLDTLDLQFQDGAGLSLAVPPETSTDPIPALTLTPSKKGVSKMNSEPKYRATLDVNLFD